MVREILFATDFSEASRGGERVTLEYARAFGARLHLLHVIGPGHPENLVPMQELADRVRSGVRVVTAFRTGAPAEEIVRYAEGHGIDLIVTGTHGRAGVTRAILGSVAERVARTAPCPVLTVPWYIKRFEEGLDRPSMLQLCSVCARESRDPICSSCRARVHGEALQRKQDQERTGPI